MIKQIISLFEKNKSVYLPLIYMSCTIMYKDRKNIKRYPLFYMCALYERVLWNYDIIWASQIN